jgi:hypothetical protein
MAHAEGDGAELQATLDGVRHALAPAEAAMEELRRAIEMCWPRKPSLRVLDAESHALYKSARDLVEAGGGRFPSPWGALVMVIAAAYDTLNAFGRGDTSDSVDFSWTWNATRVDHEAPSRPNAAAASTLRAALSHAEFSHQQVCELLDDIASRASTGAWLPRWDTNEARAYIAAIGGQGRRKWQHSHPPQPPHTYTVRAWRPDLQRDFLAFAQLIQACGELKTWGGNVHAYLALDGLEYWTMGARVPETTVINRAPVDAPDAARSLSTLTHPRLRRALERALAYRRARAGGSDAGSLSERLRALLAGSHIR